MSINLIACLDRGYGIGNEQKLLFRIKNDLRRFQSLTTGQIVVYGRKTLESLPHPLPNRVNVVLTRDENYQAPPGVIVMHSVETIVKHYFKTDTQTKDIWICGGEQVYKAFIPFANEAHLTFVDKEADKVDTYFPYNYMKQHLEIVSSEKHYSEEEECNYTFITYRHK